MSFEGVGLAVLPLLVALFNLLAAGYALAAGREDRRRLGFALGPLGVGLWALAWFLSLFNPDALPTYQTLGSVAGLVSMSGFTADTLREASTRRGRRRRLALVLTAGVTAVLWFLAPRRDLVSLVSLSLRALSVGLVLFVLGAAWLERASDELERRRFARRTSWALGAATLFYVLFAAFALWRGGIGVDPLLFVVLSAESLTLLYVAHRRVEIHILLARAATYLILSMLVGLVAAVVLTGLGYALDLVLLSTVVLIALLAALLFLALGELVARGIERLVFPDRARLTSALELARVEVETLRRRLEQTERLAIAGEMAATVAHEIKNPLSPVRGYAQLLKARLAHVDEAERAFFEKGLGIIEQEVDRIDARIMQLLDATRPDESARAAVVDFDLEATLLESIAVAEGTPGVTEIRRQLDPAARRALGHPEEVRTALVNLLKNAAEAMAPDGGGPIEIRTQRAEDRVVLEIRDEGPGLPGGDAARLFEAFYTTKEGGTGLGMMIARAAIEGSGGQLSLEPRADRRGAVVRVELRAVGPKRAEEQ